MRRPDGIQSPIVHHHAAPLLLAPATNRKLCFPRQPKNSRRRIMKFAVAQSLSEEAFGSIRAWTDEAKKRIQVGQLDLPSAKALRKLLPVNHPRCSIVETIPGYEVSNGRSVIGFKTRVWPKEATKPRYVLVVHFVVLRALELVPGIKVFLAGDRNKGRDAADGVSRPQEQMIFNLTVSIAKHKMRVLGQTKLDRILFNVDKDTSLYARRKGDHHYIVPSGSIPIAARIRKRPYSDQEALLRAVRAMIERPQRLPPPCSANEMLDVLMDLFAIGDELHWGELDDRLPRDENYRRRVPRDDSGEPLELLLLQGLLSPGSPIRPIPENSPNS
jgi:hypothetical protein